jgi:hypothetical protein
MEGVNTIKEGRVEGWKEYKGQTKSKEKARKEGRNGRKKRTSKGKGWKDRMKEGTEETEGSDGRKLASSQLSKTTVVRPMVQEPGLEEYRKEGRKTGMQEGRKGGRTLRGGT